MAYESERWRCDPGAEELMCNSCIYNHRDLTCDAFPKGIPIELINREEHDTSFPGDNGIRYKPIEDKE
ncbi:MAG: hypothetical protein UIM53_00475 [Acutalibacteraceae bacterium]|nr:hypothetical protein [Acutalibacteraceae bacterium]